MMAADQEPATQGLRRRGASGSALELSSVSSGYGQASVLHDVSLTLQAGEIMAIVGRNGMGKSTLLRTIAGFLAPTQGSIQVLAHPTAQKQPFEVARMGLGYVAQARALFPDLTIQENVALALAPRNSLDDAFARIGEIFPVLPDRRQQLAGTLSGGEQKMLILARALIADPRLLLIDEITEGLQPSVRETLRLALATETARRSMTVVLVEQDLAFAFALAERYAVMKLGRIVKDEPTEGRQWQEVARDHLAV
jgi:branched-chain amino acid transport system ATP-binding protein